MEGTYTQLLRRGSIDGARLGELLARLHVRYASVPIVFAETRALGERRTFDFFNAAASEKAGAPSSVPPEYRAPAKTCAKRKPRVAAASDEVS